jgi:acyl dehydratase
MAKMNRRKFLKVLGQGTAAVSMGMGLSGSAWIRSASAQMRNEPDPKHPDWSDWEFYYPGKYNTQDTKVLKEFQAQLALINNKGNINISDLISGKLEGKPGIGRATKITSETMTTAANTYGAENPMWCDPNYAKNTKRGAMAMPFGSGPGPTGLPAMPKSEGIGDYMVVSAHNDTVTYYKPIYQGDTIYSVIEEEHCIDITPLQGSHYRTFTMGGWGRFYNQKGELVGEGACILKESFRRRKDPAKRHPNGTHAWESPDWWSRPQYQYTDKDWETIIDIWKNEKIRGAQTLYWDDVNIGDEPAPRAVGPIITDVETDILMSSKLSTDLKHQVLDPQTFKKMVKNKHGIYVLPEYVEKKPAPTPPTTTAGGVPELGNRDGRCVLMNAVAAYWAGGMITNWMGDDGWLQRIGWDIMELPPGTSESINFEEDPTIIPPIPMENRPPLFDKYPYMDKIPLMRGKRAAWHALEGDLVISKACVADKYRQGNEYFVDLIWWCETLDNYLIEEGFATVKLPKR